MSTSRFVRKARREVPRIPGGEVSLQAPPEIPRVVPGNLITKLLPLVMVVAMVGMMALMFSSGMARSPMSMLFPIMMMVSMLGMLAGGGKGGPKASEANEDRKDYLRYLDQLRKDVDETGEQQRKSLEWSHPEPRLLWTLAGTSRMWERRTNDPDYCHVRVGRGSQRLATRLIAPETGPVDDLEPVAAVSLRRFVRAHSVVQDLPTAVSLRGFASIAIDGQRSMARSLVQSMLMQLCTFHGPDHLLVAVVCGPDTEPEWEWAKWLPHAQHPEVADGIGTSRMVYGSILELESALGPMLTMRGRFSRNAPAAPGVPQMVIVVDGGILDGESGMITDGGIDSVTVLDISGYCPRLTATRGLQLVADNGSLGARSGSGVEMFATADLMNAADAQTLARRLAPFRTPSQTAVDSGDDDDQQVQSWGQMVGIGSVGRLNPEHAWLPRSARDRLRIPIGVGVDGGVVEIDLKESAENGMGPHGLCIGATGSGKSEFLRTLVLGLVATHSPDALNLILVDFKGGATFLGLEGAPHVAAVITNLAEELDMVDRMKDALAGEMNRRQELLRSAGNFANVTEYEKARVAGAALDPLPALFIVVDEFSELLSQHPDFADLFVAIGRLGRSLHIHLLLASQRLEEGKLRGLDSHLSYRIGLKTFSANESRSVLGVPDAYHLPASPGAGYLKCDSAEIVRFQASYVSGTYEGDRADRIQERGSATVELRPKIFTASPVAADIVDEPEYAPLTEINTGPPETRTTIDVVVERIDGHGNPAHEVWLPPLDAPAALDELLPRSILTEPVNPLSTLRAPIGIVDRPYDQRRDPLVVDLSGATGNMAIVGGPQSGKSTALRTLIMSMSMTHTAEQVQFYCLDFGGGTLAGLSGLPHVGSVANRLDIDRVRRTLAEMTTIVRDRELRFRELGIESMTEFRRQRAEHSFEGAAGGAIDDSFGDVFLVIDGYASIRQDFESLDQAINNLAAQGLSYGVHLVVSAGRWGEIRPALKDQLGTRIELRLGDPSDSDLGRKVAALVPVGRPGRGMTRDNLHLLIGLPRVDGSSGLEDLSSGVQHAVAAIAGATPGKPAPAVRMLPERITRDELLGEAGSWPASVDRTRACLRIPIGLDEAELAPTFLNFAEQPHFMVFGDSECGKTTLLRNICEGIMDANTGKQVKIVMCDYRRTLLGAVPKEYLAGYAPSSSVMSDLMKDLAGRMQARTAGPDITQQQLRDRSWWEGPEVFVVIDDYDLVVTSSGNPVAPLLEYLPHARDLGLHVIISRRSGGAGRAMYEPIIARLRDLVSPGLVMSGNREEGNLLGTVRPSAMPPGRGTLVSRNGSGLVQLAWMPPQI